MSDTEQNLVRVKLTDLTRDPSNARLHDARNLEAIRASLRRFGQQHPIIVDLNNVVVAGNGRIEAMRAEGWEECNVVYTDLDGDERKAFAIADNRTAELAEWDFEELAATLEGIDANLVEAAGFSEDEFAYLLRSDPGEGNPDPSQEWDGMPEYAHDDKTSDSKVIVHFRSPEDREAFGKLIGQLVTSKTRSLWHPKAVIETYADKSYTEE